MSAPSLRAIERQASLVAMRLSLAECEVPPAAEIAVLGLLTRKFMEANGIASVVVDGGVQAEGDRVYGALLPFTAAREKRMQLLLEEAGKGCWEAPVLTPPEAEGNRHTWAAHPSSTPQQRERGWHRLQCSACHIEAVRDSSG